jgi:hypothetical protein
MLIGQLIQVLKSLLADRAVNLSTDNVPYLQEFKDG